jgi:hypothetical protein
MNYPSDSSSHSGSPQSKLPDLSVMGDVGIQLFGLAVSQSQTMADTMMRAAKCRSPAEFAGLTTHLWRDAFRQQMDVAAKIALMLTPTAVAAGDPVAGRAFIHPHESIRQAQETAKTIAETVEPMRETAKSAGGTTSAPAPGIGPKNASLTRKDSKKANCAQNDLNHSPIVHDEPKKAPLHHNELKNAPKNALDEHPAP